MASGASAPELEGPGGVPSEVRDFSEVERAGWNAGNPPPRDPVHGTDCAAWYLWAAEYLPEMEFHALYGPRRNAIRAKRLGDGFGKFLERLESGVVATAADPQGVLRRGMEILQRVREEYPALLKREIEAFLADAAGVLTGE